MQATDPTLTQSTTPKSLFIRYVAQNIFGQIGMSAYILVDTYFISKAEGADGITALNLVLPFFNLIYAFGAMYAIGSATRFTILRARGQKDADLYFTNAVFWAILTGIPFMLAGTLAPEPIIRLLGGNQTIVNVGVPYMRIFMLFAPLFMVNQIFNAFTRNDGAPTTAMIATMMSGIFNMVFDYIFMFPCRMGMAGAALATVFSPCVGITICSTHILSRRSGVKFLRRLPSLRRIISASQLGISGFIGEIASAVTTVVFNYLILGLSGNTGVAAFGVICNIALVVTSVFNGVSQGAQPLFSRYYGMRMQDALKETLGLAIRTSLLFAAGFLILFNLFPAEIVKVFNSGNSPEMASLAETGMRLYFIGYLFAGFNIIGSGYLGATANALWALITSLARGVVFIILCAVIMAAVFGMQGIWLAFTVSELLTAGITLFALLHSFR